MATFFDTTRSEAPRITAARAWWKPAFVAFCTFFSSLYLIVKLPILVPYFPTGAKEIILLVTIAGCLGYAFFLDLTKANTRYLLSPAFLAGFAAIVLVSGHILVGASRQTVSLAALQLSLFPLLFLFVGGVQTNLRAALTWLSAALVATGVLALAFVFWDSATGDAYLLKNIDRSRELAHLTWFNYEGLRREAGIFESGITLCSHLGLAVLGAVYLILRKRARTLCLCVLPLLAIGIALSLSRLGLVAMVAGILVLLGAFRHRRLLRVTGAVTLAILGLALFSKAFPDVLQLYVQRTLSAFTGDSAQDARYDAWDSAVDIIARSPFGVGIGTAGGKVNPESQVAISESTFLKVGIELGAVAVIGFLALYLLALRRTLLAARELSWNDDSVELRLDLSFLAALVVTTLVNHAFVQAIEYFSYGPISMIVLGMALNIRLERGSRGAVVRLSGVAQ